MCRYEPLNKGLVGACCPCGARRLRILIDHRRVRLRVRLGPFRRRWGFHLARTLHYLPANGLQRRRDALRQGVAALGRPLLHLRLHRALAEGEMHHHLAAVLAAVRDREPPRVVASGLRAPLHPMLALVHGEVALGVEGSPLLPGYSSVVLILWPGTPSAEGPSAEEATTGGRYSGRLATSESQAKTSSGGASMVWLCSYSWGTVFSLRRPTGTDNVTLGARLLCYLGLPVTSQPATRNPRTFETTLTPPGTQYRATQCKPEKGNPSKYAAFANTCNA